MRSAALLLALVPLPAVAQRADTARPPATAAAAPRTVFDGPALEFDFPSLLIGTAEYDDGPTGATVFYFPARVTAAVDVRGGAPGTVNTDALRLSYGAQMTALVLAGGSWHGLAAVTGAADAIRAHRVARGEAPPIVGVAGAIVNDIGFGASIRRFSNATPDARLAAAAVQAARPGRFPLGARGAGRFAMTGAVFGPREFSGQGGAFKQVGATKIGVFTVVNAAGLVVDRGGRVVRCRAMRTGGDCGAIADRLRSRIDTMAAVRPAASGPPENTTITIVVTNQRLEPWALERLAAQVHTSMARAIQPFATAGDGDVLFAVTTAEVDNPRLSAGELTLAASELAWDAVLSSVPLGDARVATRPIPVEARTLEEYAGEYELGPAARVIVRREGDRLVVESSRGGQYFPAGAPTALVRVGAREFLLDTRGGDRLRFEHAEGGRVAGFTLNPGQWALTARRVGGTVHADPDLERAAHRVIGFLRGEVPFDSLALADTVELRLAPEGGGAVSRVRRGALRNRTAWAVAGSARRISFVPPTGYSALHSKVGRHFNCHEQDLATRAPDLASRPHVGVRLQPDRAESCLQSWNATFVFDTTGGSARLTAVVYDQWEW